jgi:hypothetical protein
MMKDDSWPQLEAFTRVELGRPLFGGQLNLQPSSRLTQDLGLTGHDGTEFIDAWAQRFKVDVRGFSSGRYFGPEGFDVLSPLLGLFSKRFRRPALVPLTLGMLAEAMRRGRWDAAEIEAMMATQSSAVLK